MDRVADAEQGQKPLDRRMAPASHFLAAARTVTFKNRAACLLIEGTGRASGGSAVGQDAHRLPWRPPAGGRQGRH
jgi:hypothetical protein